MNTSNKALDLRLNAPPQPVCVRIGESFPVEVRVLTSNVSQCAVKIILDEAALENLTEDPNPRQLGGGKISEDVRWPIRAKRKTDRTDVIIEARANGLFQTVQFPVEVIAS
jgi:hypothetical protein